MTPIDWIASLPYVPEAWAPLGLMFLAAVASLRKDAQGWCVVLTAVALQMGSLVLIFTFWKSIITGG